jgi:hypothetical protein
MVPSQQDLAAARGQVAAQLEAHPVTGSEEEQRRQLSRALRDWLADYEAAAEAGGEPEVSLELQAIRVGELAIVATAAETFCAIGTEIARRSPFLETVVLGYSNGCIGYLPTFDAYPLGGYEIDGAYRFYGTLMIAPDSEARTVEAAAGLLGELR